MQLRFLGGRFQGRVVNIPGDSFSIGRGQRNDLAIDQDGISRYHCKLSCENGSWYIEDLESTNGVRLNGNRITGKQPIRAGDRIGISGNLLLFSEESAEETSRALSESLKNLEYSRHAITLDSNAKTQPDILGDAPAAQVEESDEDMDNAPLGFPWGRVIAFALVLLVFLALGVDYVFKAIEGGESKPESVVEVDDSDDGDEDSLWAESPEAEGAGTEQRDESDRSLDDEPASSQTPSQDGDEAVDGEDDGGDSAAADAEPVTPDSTMWYAVLRSEPSGATAFINDEEAGTTPLAVKLEPGRHRLRLKKDGYEELQRLIDDGVLQPRKPFVLRQDQGTFMIKTEPPGATVLHGRQLLGTTPLLITTLPKGDHPLTLKKHGYETREVVVEVSAIQGNEEKVELVARLGTLEVVSLPPGCTVRVDGVRKGITQPGEGGLESDPLVIPDLLEGKHELQCTHPLGGDRSGTVGISAGEVLRRQVRFWVPDRRFTLKNGEQIYGMLVPVNKQDEIVLLDRAWERRRFAADAVKEDEKLSSDHVRQILENREDGAAELELENGNADGDAADLPAPDFRLDAEVFEQEIRQTAVGDLRDQFDNKIVRARGVPRKIIAADRIVHVWLGDSIHCQLNEDLLPAIRAAKKADKPLLLQGTVDHCTGEEIVVSGCTVVPE
ncbi:MAG: PEGA domain-containing protein [Verrucomicrobiota bacterium]